MKVIVSKTCANVSGFEQLTSGMVGKSINVEYSADWSGLTVVAVFSNGSVTKDVLNPGNACVIPHEILESPNKHATVGFYGYVVEDGEKVIAIPTVLADLGRIAKGADPSGDPSAELSPTVAEQLQADVNDLDERVTYLEEHGGGGEGSNEIWLPTVDGNGNISWQKSSTETTPIARNIKGPQGEQGPAGADGEKGEKGDAGAQGPVGPAGPKGDTGAAGAKGDTGATGPAGPQGPAGTNGTNGYTPVRGTDYWTAADIASIKGYVDDAILNGEW